MEILEGCKDDDPEYQKGLYDLYYNYAFKICFRYTRNREDVLEIVNDGYMKIFNKIKGFAYPLDSGHLDAAFQTWMKKIMVYTAIDYLRRKSNRVFYKTTGEDIDRIDTGLLYYADNLGYNELIELVRLLPQSYRWVFNLYVIDGYSHKEIADLLKISESTSRSNLVKAREHLRRMLKKTYEETLIKYN